MRRRRLSLLLALALGCGLAMAASAGAASIWTPVTSGTSQTISAIATPKAGEVVYTTTVGEIHYLNGSGTFTKATLSPPMSLAFEDVAMSPEGNVGIAVGEGGKIYRSINSGVSWTALSGLTARSNCAGGGSAPITSTIFSVHYATASVIYATDANRDVLRSTDGGATFTDVNKGSSSCTIGEPVGDTYWRDANNGYLLTNNFGELFRTTDGLGGSGGGTEKRGEGPNGFSGGDRLAVDGEDPLRLWATSPLAEPLGFVYSTNAGLAWNPAALTDGPNTASFTDIGAGIGTNVVAVGSGGAIYTSTDGTTFVRQPAPAPNETTSWEAVAFQPSSTIAWVGGTNGALVSTSQSNVLPPAPPAPPSSGGSSGSSSSSSTQPSTAAPTAKPKPAPMCHVPKLDGKSLKASRKKLAAAHCKLGKVTKKGGATAKDGEVTGQSPKAGKKLPGSTKVAVTLAP